VVARERQSRRRLARPPEAAAGGAGVSLPGRHGPRGLFDALGESTAVRSTELPG
jgi:hypothetical protein